MAILNILTLRALAARNYAFLSFSVAFVVFLPTFFIYFFGAPATDSVKFCFYVLIYHGLNGFLALSFFKQKITGNLKVPFILLTGVSYNILTFFILSLFHWQSYTFLNILPLLGLVVFYKTPLLEAQSEDGSSFVKNIFNIFLLLIPLFIALLAFCLQETPNNHFFFQGAIANSVAHNQYPYHWHTFPEVPLFYNYGYHLDMASNLLLTSIPMEQLSTRFYPSYTFFLLMLTVYSFCKAYLKGGSITGWLAIACSFCVVGFFSYSTTLFLNALPSSLTLVGSSTLALSLFFVIVDRIYNFINTEELCALDYIFVIMLFFVAAASRSALPVVLLGGMGLFLISEFFKKFEIRSLLPLIFLTTALTMVFIITLIIVYGILTPYSATGFMSFFVQNTIFAFGEEPLWLLRLRSHLVNYGSLGHSIEAMLHILFISGYLVVGFYYQIYKWFIEKPNKLELLLIYCCITGLVVWNFTTAPGGSHYTFLHYSQLICGIFAANGTYLLFRDTFQKRSTILWLLSGLSLLTFSVKSYELYNEIWYRGHLQTSSFQKPPIFHMFPKELLVKISSIPEKNHNVVFLLLSTRYGDDKTSNVMSIILRAIPVYNESNIKYLLTYFTHFPLSERKIEINNQIIQFKTLNDQVVNNFRSLFPGKKLIFLVDKQQLGPLQQYKDAQVITTD